MLKNERLITPNKVKLQSVGVLHFPHGLLVEPIRPLLAVAPPLTTLVINKNSRCGAYSQLICDKVKLQSVGFLLFPHGLLVEPIRLLLAVDPLLFL